LLPLPGALAVLSSIRIPQYVEFAYRLDAQQVLDGPAGLHVVLSNTGELDTIQQKQILRWTIAGR
jgi:hypothetical protein